MTSNNNMEKTKNSAINAGGVILAQQSRMNSEFKSRQHIAAMPYDIRTSHFIIPEFGKSLNKAVYLPEESCKNVQLIFSALYTANYIIYQLGRGNKTQKRDAHTNIPKFLSFININKEKVEFGVKILKEYETHRVKNEKVNPKCTGISFLRVAIKMALDEEMFFEKISEQEFHYLYMLTKTKSAPGDMPVPRTLTKWFAEHSWLRRDDVGVGHEIFSRLASPKATMDSFQITVAVAFQEIQSAKNALIDLFREAKIAVDDIQVPAARSEFPDKSKHDIHVRECFIKTFKVIREKYHEIKNDKKSLETAIHIIVFENIRAWACEKHSSDFFSNRPATKTSAIMTRAEGFLFSLPFLRELAAYATGPRSGDAVVPACLCEHMLFQWLMASQTVQASDIAKTTTQNFRFVARRDGRVTHLQHSYYKGRAKTEHSTRDIDARTCLGQGLLQFIRDRTPADYSIALITIEIDRMIFASVFERFIHILNIILRDKIEKQLSSKRVSAVFLNCMVCLMEKRIKYNLAEYGSIERYWHDCETPVRMAVFSLSAIKTSAVHASSDTFNPTQLINYHSHTDKTERISYLTPANEEWINNCGRVTRAVMQDLAVNLFRASQAEKQIFNSELTRAVDIISSKCEETLARMKLVTDRTDGRVDDLGFVSFSKQLEGLADSIYLLDSPETVMKLRHYLSQVRKKHYLLAKHTPEYLLFTVLPTTEWIESLFQNKRFSSVDQGDALYRKYCDELPPLFGAQIGS